METLWRVVHTTRYDFDRPASHCALTTRLTPRDGSYQQCVHHQLVTRPPAAARRERRDRFGNAVATLEIEAPLHTLELTATSHVRLRERTPVAPDGSAAWEDVRRSYRSPANEVRDFLWDRPQREDNLRTRLCDYAGPSFPAGRPVPAAAADLAERISREFRYDPRATTVSTSVSDVLRHRRGVCQDFARLMSACLRAMGLAARYVSGYVAAPAPSATAAGRGGDSHAWVAVHDPHAGWIDLDPTRGEVPGSAFVTLAWGRDYDDVAPVLGAARGGSGHALEVGVVVERLPDAPGAAAATDRPETGAGRDGLRR